MSRLTNYLFILGLLFMGSLQLTAQDNDVDHGSKSSLKKDSLLHMDANYQRPSIQIGSSSVSIGGYFEANTFYEDKEGDTDGLAFQMRRLAFVVASPITKHLNFMTEIEFEDQGREVSLEYAALDLNLYTELNFRGGLIINPIGSFNQNHDGPKWEFVERPMQAAKLLPATFRNVGFGVFGKTYKNNWILGYEAYLTNGFNDLIINNPNRRTYLPATKGKPLGRASISHDESQGSSFENFSGKPMFTGKIALKNRGIGEIGFSYMGGPYNKQADDEGLELDSKSRRVDVIAVDLSTDIKTTGTALRGEVAYIWVDVPETYTQLYGNQQWGVFLDIVQPILKRKVLSWEDATLNVAARLDYVDYNVGTFRETAESIGDHVLAITPAISFRPTDQTVFRLNYRYEMETDELRNPAELTATWYFGFSTYF